MSTTGNGKLVLKNSILLYVRMLFTLGITLYTSRVFLNVLGVVDFGIFNVVGGVVTMLGFLNASLAGAASRFLAYNIGTNNVNNLKDTFSTILYVHIILALIVAVIGETVGIWFVYNKLIIPEERLFAATCVYHASIVIAVINILSVPYNSIIIAYEKMNVYAYVSILDVVLKLLILWLVLICKSDKLIIYSVFLLIVQCAVQIINILYCRSNFKESRVRPKRVPKCIKQILSFAFWTVNGNLAVVGYTQGINILLNMFFGPVVNAARGISVQVQSGVMSFIQSFQVAVRPQIIKSYAVGDMGYLHNLVILSSKLGSFLVMMISFPINLCLSKILSLWLGEIPEYTEVFVKLMLLSSVIYPLNFAMITSIHSTGDIKKFQILEGSCLLSIVPIAYFLLKYTDVSPEVVIMAHFFVEIITQCVRVYIVLPQINMSYSLYMKSVICPLILPTIIMVLPIIFIHIPSNISVFMLLVYLLSAFIYMTLVIIFIGFSREERFIFRSYLYRVLNKYGLLQRGV